MVPFFPPLQLFLSWQNVHQDPSYRNDSESSGIHMGQEFFQLKRPLGLASSLWLEEDATGIKRWTWLQLPLRKPLRARNRTPGSTPQIFETQGLNTREYEPPPIWDMYMWSYQCTSMATFLLAFGSWGLENSVFHQGRYWSLAYQNRQKLGK